MMLNWQLSVVAALVLLPNLALGEEVVASVLGDDEVLAEVLVPSKPVLEVHENNVVLNATGEEGVELTSFLESAQRVLGRPMKFSPTDMSGTRLYFMGSPVCPVDHFRDFFDQILLSQGFLCFDVPAAGSGYIVVSKNEQFRSGRGGGKILPRLHIPVSQLDEAPRERAALYEAIFQLEHLDSRALMATLQPMVDSTLEGLRSTSENGSLLVTTLSVERLREIRDVLVALDVPGVRLVPSEAQRLKALEELTAELKAEIEKLKAQIES